jgi:hypothetical protein
MKRAHLEGLLRESLCAAKDDAGFLDERKFFSIFFELWEVDETMDQERHAHRERTQLQMFLAFVFLVIFLMFMAAASRADTQPTITARVTYVRGEGNVPRVLAQRISAQNAAYLSAKTGIAIKIRSFRVVSSFGIKHTLKNASRQLTDCEAYNWSHGCTPGSHYGICHCLLPPIVEADGKKWLAGNAEDVCYKGGSSYSNAVQFNALGASRYLHSLVAMGHEVSHIIGGKEVWSEPCTLMYTGVLYCIDRNQYEISTRSITEIKQCVRSW